ncbi:MAG: hypothetical protein HY319_06185 [Armatimonadetes bacterium]|nr:hypothetical protein [Armatimonadota bacterium]
MRLSGVSYRQVPPRRAFPRTACTFDAEADGLGAPAPRILLPADLPPPPLATAGPDLRLQNLDARTPAEIVRAISDYALGLPCILQGLDHAYSPNHPQGMTTRVHIEKQLQMVNFYVGGEMAAVEALGRADYDALHRMVDNPDAPPALRVGRADLEAVLEPLRAGLSPADWKILATVAAFHDLGKMDPQWARAAGMNLQGVDWIAHDYDSETILVNNPELLGKLCLRPDELAKTLALCRLHSLPGQFFFGEGNVSAYNPLFRVATDEKRESVLKLARIHGLLDVMSALNHKFVKPILESHQLLRTFISDAYEHNTPLGMKFRQTAVQELEKASVQPGRRSFTQVANRFGVGPVAMYRLLRLMGGKLKPEDFENAFEGLDPEIVYEFQEATDREQTWFGTYVANAFGSGMVKALKAGAPEQMATPAEVIQAMVKMLGCAARFHREQEQVHGRREEWALSALKPALEVSASPEGALRVLGETRRVKTVRQGVELLTSGGAGLSLRGGQTGVEIGYLLAECH